ncbi:hypothetical protein H0H93_008797 [Arthromyces matolae]|nr:hypothetical protein H0H93_008797 [Arthromyces matolae]
MTIFYSDNHARADRLQQLINNIGVIQTDIANEQKRMNQLDAECQEKLDELLKAGQIESLQELKEKAFSKLTEDEKEEFNQLISATKTVAQVTETMLWAGLLFGGNKLLELSGKVIMSIVRGVAEIQAVRVAVAAFVDTVSNIIKGGASAGRALAQAASKARDLAEGAKRVTGLANAESPVSRIFKFLGKIGKWLSWFGVVLVAATPLIELFAGGQQKQDLIEGIHETQVTRLVVNVLKHQARNITEQMSSTNMYLSMLKKGKKVFAEALGAEMIDSIQRLNDKINLHSLEDSLHEADLSTLNFYGGDDLGKSAVVMQAETELHKDMNSFNAQMEK